MEYKDRLVEDFYTLLSDEEDARVCHAISPDACREVPGNFLKILLGSLATKLSDVFSSAKIILPWVMASAGVPNFFSALLVPIRESGSLLPQLLIGAWIRNKPIRKHYYVLGSLIQALIFITIGMAVHFSSGVMAGCLILLALTISSFSRGVNSIASKDVLGKTIPKQKRGVLSGYASSFAGFISIGVGVALLFDWHSQKQTVYLLLASASICCLFAAYWYSRINEYAGATEGGVNGVKEALESISVIKKDKPFRNYLITRALMMSSALAAPFIILLAQQSQQSHWFGLGGLIILSGIATTISSVIWGKLADKNSRFVLSVTALLTSLICFITACYDYFNMTCMINNSLVYGLAFFCLAVTHQGVRLGRKIYVVDLAEGNQRTTYVAVGNTMIGVLLLFVGLFGAVLSSLSIAFVLFFFGSLSLLALFFSRQMEPLS